MKNMTMGMVLFNDNLELAKEWAVCKSNEQRGYVHKFVLDTEGLKIFDFVSFSFTDCDKKDFINCYMKIKTHKAIDDGQAYVNTMDYKELRDYFFINPWV